MNSADTEQCLLLIGSGYSMERRSFDWKDEMLRDLYRDVLLAANVAPDSAFASIRFFCQNNDRAPKTGELAEILRGLAVRRSDSETYRRPAVPVEPGHAYRLMREGYLAHRQREHGDQYIYPEMDTLMKRIAELRETERQTWRANQTAEGFAARPSIVLDEPPTRDSRPTVPERFAQPVQRGGAVLAERNEAANLVDDFMAGVPDDPFEED